MRPRIGRQPGAAPSGDEGALHVRLHGPGRRQRRPADRRIQFHPEAVHARGPVQQGAGDPGRERRDQPAGGSLIPELWGGPPGPRRGPPGGGWSVGVGWGGRPPGPGRVLQDPLLAPPNRARQYTVYWGFRRVLTCRVLTLPERWFSCTILAYPGIRSSDK